MLDRRPNSVWPALVPLAAHNDPDSQIVAASGATLTFADGSEALCGTSGLWNVNLGYGNQHIADAVHEAMVRASYVSLFRYWSEDIEQAAVRLREVAGVDRYARVLFTTAGGSANDAVMKLARHFAILGGQPARKTVVGLKGSYHGLTYGAHALSGDDLGQSLYGVDSRQVRHVTPNDLDELERLVAATGDRIAAVIVEPILGSGAFALTDEYLQRLCELRNRHGFLIVADEVATGFGRTGLMFASESWPSPPDILIASKGLTNGTQAAAAILVGSRITDRFTGNESVFVHAETQAGTPVVGAAISATIDEFDRLSAIERSQQLAATLETELTALAAQHPSVLVTRGTGNFRAVAVADRDGQPQRDPASLAALRWSIRRAGAVVHPGADGFQLVPALTYTDEDVRSLFDAVRVGLQEYDDANLR
ncbi:adenosylmethionine-8-amino-7-oxononanoate aminotransferase [Curtobacterium flaccumfaciens]|nr:daptide-type RiPP biosynthesis aminotransferase [Curtobacterium flaccumfaciens]MDQ0537505.1 adenosylmethionine-8-amino-7-oxononanoate aminotransferase [Curtobacterium flaccumfaciens]